MKDTSPLDINERIWFHPFCNEDEIDRILSPQNAKDFLLNKRANIVADNVRLYRVYRSKAYLIPSWSFENSFATIHYEEVIKHLNNEDKKLCNDITYGDIFSNDVNGYAEKNNRWGKLIYLNESLQYFMKFCNLALLDFNTEVPWKIRVNALRIAIRVVMKNEALDFFLDPRGIVPTEVGQKMHLPIKNELQYIAGHEFSHYLCGHLDDKSIKKRAVLSIDDKNYMANVYNPSQKQEFEADLNSIIRPQYNKKEIHDLLYGALLWFTSLELWEVAQEFCNPTSSFAYKSHPSATERYNYILNNVKIPIASFDKRMKSIRERAEKLKDFLLEDLQLHIENYEMYGSAYLAEPNSEWRGRELIDRVDY